MESLSRVLSRQLFESSKCYSLCHTTIDETKLRLSPSAKQHRNPCLGPPSVFRDLSTRHDWPVKKAIVDLPVKMNGNSKSTSF